MDVHIPKIPLAAIELRDSGPIHGRRRFSPATTVCLREAPCPLRTLVLRTKGRIGVDDTS